MIQEDQTPSPLWSFVKPILLEFFRLRTHEIATHTANHNISRDSLRGNFQWKINPGSQAQPCNTRNVDAPTQTNGICFRTTLTLAIVPSSSFTSNAQGLTLVKCVTATKLRHEWRSEQFSLTPDTSCCGQGFGTISWTLNHSTTLTSPSLTEIATGKNLTQLPVNDSALQLLYVKLARSHRNLCPRQCQSHR